MVSSSAGSRSVGSRAAYHSPNLGGEYSSSSSVSSKTTHYPHKENRTECSRDRQPRQKSCPICKGVGEVLSHKAMNKRVHALNGNVLSIVAFKVMIIYLVAIAKTTLHHNGEGVQGVTSLYNQVPNAEYAWKVTMQVPFHEFPAKMLNNGTGSILLVDTPVGIDICRMLQFLAPTMPCRSGVVEAVTLREHLDLSFIKTTFSLSVLDLTMNATLYNLVLSNRINWDYLVESTPTWFVNLTQPLVFDTICPGCKTSPNWGEFIGRGTFDTTVNFAAWGATRYARTVYKSYRDALIEAASRGGLPTGPTAAGWTPSPETSLSSAQAAEALGASPTTLIELETIDAAAEVFELAPLAPALAGPSTSTLGMTIGMAPMSTSAVSPLTVASALSGTGKVTRFSTPPGIRRLFENAKNTFGRIVAAEKTTRLTTADAVAQSTLRRLRTVTRMSQTSPFVSMTNYGTNNVRIGASQAIEMSEVAAGSATGAIAAGVAAVPVVVLGSAAAGGSLTSGAASYLALLPKLRKRRSPAMRRPHASNNVTVGVHKTTNVTGSHKNVTSRPASTNASSTTSTTTSTTTLRPTTQPTTTSTQVSANSSTWVITQNPKPKHVVPGKDWDLGKRYKNDSRVMGTVGRILKSGPNRIKRQAGPFLGLIFKSPSWVVPTTLSAIGWGFATTSLQTSSLERRVLFPIPVISATERYYIAITSIILCSCFHSLTPRAKHTIDGGQPPVLVNGRYFGKSDVVFDMNTNQAGETLHACSPLFKMAYEGMPPQEMTRSMAMLFDMSYLRGQVLYYNGPPSFIVSDYQAYFSTTFPTYNIYGTQQAAVAMAKAMDTFVPLESWEQTNAHTVVKRQADGEGTTSEYDDMSEMNSTKSIFNRTELERSVVGGSAYLVMGATGGSAGHRTFISVPLEYPTINWMANIDLVNSLDQLMVEPAFRYEFDMIQTSSYNGTASYVSNLRHFMEASRINEPIVRSHAMYSVPRGLSLREVLRAINPFDMSFPRLHVVRELLDGYKPTRHLQSIVKVARTYGRDLKYMNLTTLLATFYAEKFADDDKGIDDTATGLLSQAEFTSLLEYLYTNSYARIPVAVIVSNPLDVAKFKNMFLAPVRDTLDPASWRYYSPFLVTPDTYWVQRAAYSLCISPKKAMRTATRGRFAGLNVVGSPRDRRFGKACFSASMHVKYESDITSIAANHFIPARILTFLTANDANSEWTQDMDQPTYDPGLSEIVTSLPKLGDEGFESPEGDVSGVVDRSVNVPPIPSALLATRTINMPTREAVDVEDAPKWGVYTLLGLGAVAIVLGGILASSHPCAMNNTACRRDPPDGHGSENEMSSMMQESAGLNGRDQETVS